MTHSYNFKLLSTEKKLAQKMVSAWKNLRNIMLRKKMEVSEHLYVFSYVLRRAE